MRHHSQETAPSLYVQAAKDAFRKLDPRVLVRNPVMFVVAVGCVFTTASFFSRVVTGADAGFSGQISLWLWFTVLFANFAEALAEGRGKAQADTLRSARTDTVAHRLLSDGTVETVSASELAPGDRVVVEAGDMIPADGTVVEGVAAVDESAITGESAPVIRESGGDRSAVTGGTTVLSDRIVVNVTQEPGKSFLDRMIALVEGAERQKTPNEIALNILLAGLTLIFMLVVVTLKPLGLYHGINIDMVVLVARPRSAACSRPSASPGWTACSSAMCWPCRAARWRPPGTWMCCCSTRPGRSRSATAWPRRSCLCPA